ncbi:ABC transporter permease [Azotosporobacter soli]|uniref:ABC transporter permease n=1 Tax=Azotosporobacter soli TaxID=3055040 RepID=UPI0031FE86F7
MTLRQLFWRELKQIFLVDRQRAVFLFGASIIYALLFGTLYHSHVINDIPLLVYDQDQSKLSRQLIRAFSDSEKFRLVAEVSSQEEMEEALRNKTAVAALAIPADFSRDIKSGRSANVLLDANGANITLANPMISATQEIALGFSSQIGVSLLESIGQLPGSAQSKALPLSYRLRILDNPTLSYSNFFLLGLAMTALQQGLFLSSGAGILYELSDRRLLKRISPGRLLFGKLIPYWLCGLFAYALTLSLIVFVFHLPWRIGFGPLFAFGGAFIFAVLMLAALSANLFQDEVSFTQFSLVYSISSFIFSGYVWPQVAMINGAQYLHYLFPLSYFAAPLRNMALSGHAPQLGQHILTLFLLGALFGASAYLLLRRAAASQTVAVVSEERLAA